MLDPPEGLIDRDVETGEPTGLLYGVGDYFGKAIPSLERGQMEMGIKLADRELCTLGITSIHDASPRNNLDRWNLIQCWKKDGLLKTRIGMILGKKGFQEYERHRFPAQVDENQVSVGSVKIIMHETTGQLSPSQEELNEIVFQIHQSGYQAVLHAIEERTIEAACYAIEYALKKMPKSNHRHRIEHCSVCNPSLAKRLASLGIIVVTQPPFIYYNGERYLRTVPSENLKHLYPTATLMKNGVVVAGSSDCLVVPPNPLVGIYYPVSRRAENGELVLPEETISPLEALRMFTNKAVELPSKKRSRDQLRPANLPIW